MGMTNDPGGSMTLQWQAGYVYCLSAERPGEWRLVERVF